MLYFVRKEIPAKATIVKRDNAPCLLVDFYATEQPQIWQFNLKKTSTFTLKLVMDEQGEWDFGYETPKAPFKAVAHFDERGDAEDCYAIIQKAVDRGETKLRHRVLRGLLYVLIFYILLNIVGLAFMKTPDQVTLQKQIEQQMKQTSKKVTGKPQLKTGVPMAAEDVLPRKSY